MKPIATGHPQLGRRPHERCCGVGAMQVAGYSTAFAGCKVSIMVLSSKLKLPCVMADPPEDRFVWDKSTSRGKCPYFCVAHVDVRGTWLTSTDVGM